MASACDTRSTLARLYRLDRIFGRIKTIAQYMFENFSGRAPRLMGELFQTTCVSLRQGQCIHDVLHNGGKYSSAMLASGDCGYKAVCNADTVSRCGLSRADKFISSRFRITCDGRMTAMWRSIPVGQYLLTKHSGYYALYASTIDYFLHPRLRKSDSDFPFP